MTLNADVERLVVQEMTGYFPKDRYAKFSDRDIQKIAQLLSQPVSDWRSSWSSAPRLYCILRIIGLESALDDFMREGITTDIWFPFTKRSLSGVLSPSSKDKFLAAQHLVETEALYLEKNSRTGSKCEHQNFSNDDIVPLVYKRFLGKGGFGEVHEVQSKTSLKIYARKQTLKSKGFLQTKQTLETFKREREVMMKINHRHCMEFMGSYSTPKYLGLLISPVAETNLEQFLSKSHGYIEIPLLRTFFGCLSQGFRYLHDDIRIRHRDIKPGNILIHEGRVRISDFGLSLNWAEGRTTTTWSTCPGFSRKYCAPEVASAQSRNSSSDIWSLGCVFLEMVTVLKGRSVEELQKFLSTRERCSPQDEHDEEEVYYYTDPEALKEWTSQLRSMSTSDNEPIAWVNSMLDSNPKKRPRAARIVDYTSYEMKGLEWPYCGLCCVDDSDSEAEPSDINFVTKNEKGLEQSESVGLHDAARSGNEEVARRLIHNGADLEKLDKSGSTPLTTASYNGHSEIVRLLLENEADLHSMDKAGRRPLYCAAINGQEGIVKILLRAGADIEAETRRGWTALYGAAFSGQEAVVRLLLERGANKEAKNLTGKTALHAAALNGHDVIVKLLLEKGADANAKDYKETTALHGAALSGLDAIVKLLQSDQLESRS